MIKAQRLKKVWKNCVDLQVGHPLGYFQPSTPQEVITIIREAERKGYKVKAVGSGHSFSDIALTRDFLINTHKLNKILSTDLLSPLPAMDTAHLFVCECGVLIKQLNAALDARKLALPNMGAYTGQTIAGAISTATHGSGITLGSLASLVEAVVMIGENGEVFHIERGQGISAAPIQLGNVPVTLIQDDEAFLSSVVSMGCLGVTYALVLKVTDAYLLKEERTFSSWEKVKKQLRREGLLGANRHLEVLLNPYQTHTKGDHDCLITQRNICEPETSTSWFRLHRAWFYTLVGWLMPNFLLNAILRFLFNTFPKSTPYLIQASLKTLRDGCYIDKSFKVLDLGKANNIAAYSLEIAFPSASYQQAVEALFVIFGQIAADGEQYITSPFSLRFVKTSAHYLAMQYGAKDDFVCMIEFPVLKGTVGGEEILSRIEHDMYRYGGIPHWGQYNHVGIGDHTLDKLYPQFYKWMANYRRFCKKGTFENNFTERCRIIA
ncbi:L-gulono-1,4-lactone dehydrogenase [Mucilaginibacter gynuensis]|uniref:L-gulono-1,4-lactone dehydrogenase n=1 Tax=Mucilaginibacter gynuensis TaxID=1302236 RepID=A0ABP8GAC5_9SPHI